MLTHEQYDGPPWPDELPDDPLQVFEAWFEDAVDAGAPDPSACCLATSDSSGRPSARMVLFRGLDEVGFRFFTNYGSRKARELEENPRAAMVFWWEVLKRQIRVEGEVRRCPGEISDAYFSGRPRASQLGAWASEQSSPIKGRPQLEERLKEIDRRFEGQSVPRPDFWGGYRLLPHRIEFWQGRPNRLHDRQSYELIDKVWHNQRLMP